MKRSIDICVNCNKIRNDHVFLFPGVICLDAKIVYDVNGRHTELGSYVQAKKDNLIYNPMNGLELVEFYESKSTDL